MNAFGNKVVCVVVSNVFFLSILHTSVCIFINYELFIICSLTSDFARWFYFLFGGVMSVHVQVSLKWNDKKKIPSLVAALLAPKFFLQL